MDHLNPNRYDNAIPASSYMEGATKKVSFFIPLRRTELSGRVTGPVSEFTITQTFLYTKEECPETVDAVYRFPLPGDAAIDRVKAFFGRNEVESKLMERVKAESEFESARKKGKQSLLMTRESSDVFTMFLAGIRPGEEVKVQTTFVQLGDPQGIGFEFRVPLTISPRYVRGDEAGSRQASGQPLLPMIDPGHRFSMDLKVSKNGSVVCPSFGTRVKKGRMSLEAGEVLPDRDLVLIWTPSQSDRPMVQVITDGKKHFMAIVTPPKSPERLLPREITLLLDRSGSMSGAKWEATTWTAEKMLRSLGPGDRFNLCLFHTETRWLFNTPQEINAQNLKEARELLRRSDAGGTELGVAIEQALDQDIVDDEAVKHVVIVTDAEVSDAGRIVQTVREKRRKRQCSVICIDSAPNSFLAKGIAKAGDGTAKFLTSSPQERDLATALDDVMEEWAAPIASEMSLRTDRLAIDPEKGKYLEKGDGMFAVDVPHLASGRCVVMLGSFQTKGKMSFSFCALDQDGHREETDIQAAERCPGLSKLYGSAMVNWLELLASSEVDIGSVEEELEKFDMKLCPNKTTRAIYRENREAGIRALIKGQMVKASLHYNVPSSETAYLGIRKERGKAATKLAIVPNALPEGWSHGFANGSVATRGDPMNLMCGFNASPAGSPKAFMSSMQQDTSAEPMVDIELPDGIPEQHNGELVLMDSTDGLGNQLSCLMSKVTVTGTGLENTELQIFIRDMSTARVRIKLRDMVEGLLERPINVQVGNGERVLIKLVGLDKTMQGAPFRVVIT